MNQLSKTELEVKARECLAEKKQTKYYRIECETQETGLPRTKYLPFSDEDVNRIKQIIKENEIEELLYINEYEELYDLIIDPLRDDIERDGYVVTEIDFEHPHYYYQTTCIGYDKEKKEPRHPVKVKVQLTDEEYIYLLIQNMLEKNLTFNRLIMLRPELAQKINLQIDGCYYDYNIKWDEPFLVIFDEINADAEKILEGMKEQPCK